MHTSDDLMALTTAARNALALLARYEDEMPAAIASLATTVQVELSAALTPFDDDLDPLPDDDEDLDDDDE